MKRVKILPAMAVAGVLAAAAYDIVWLNTAFGIKAGVAPQETTNIAFSDDKSQVEVTNGASLAGAVATEDLQDITFGESDGSVTVRFGENGISVEYPGYFETQDIVFEINKETGVVKAYPANDQIEVIRFTVSGASPCAQLKVYGNAQAEITLDNADLTNADGSVINLQTKETAKIILAGSSKICDSKDYTSTAEGEKEKAAIFSTGSLIFEGDGSVEVTGKNKHAICAEGSIDINSGLVAVVKAKSDGLHCSQFNMNGGKYSCSGAKGDGIDADKGEAIVNGGEIAVTMAEADTKGITADAGIYLLGGNVAIELAADQGKGLRSKGDIKIDGADVNIIMTGNAVVTDGDPSYCAGIKPDGNFVVNSGNIEIESTGQGARGISVQGLAEFNGGQTSVKVACSSVKYVDAAGVEDSYSANCVSCDSTIVVNGGKLILDIAAEQGKGLKADIDVEVNGGIIEATASGDVYILNGDPSYCAAIKADDDFKMNGGSLTINHGGKGGKGISTNGKTTIKGGNIDISCTGNGVVYVNEENKNDTATPACITSDKKVTLAGGVFNLKNCGSAGKCVKGDKKIEIGAEGEDGPIIYAEATGQRVSENDAPRLRPGDGGWGPGGGGFDPNGDYANPKCFKADEDLTVFSGNITLRGSTNGGEGLESKTKLTIEGGNIDISTVDDCINAASNITINGGVIHCQASGNDGIDSNGTININGGIVISIGAERPEEGFDCDNNTFTITGGTLIGLGGATSTPTSSTCTQRVVLYNGNFTNGTVYTVCDPSGQQVVSFKSPKTINGVMLISSAGITNNGTYAIYTGGTVQGGETYYELTVGADYAPGTQTKTFNPSSMVTTIR